MKKTITTILYLTFLSLVANAQSKVFDFRTASTGYWQNEFGTITGNNYTLPDSKGSGIALYNMSGTGSEIILTSRPFLYNGWSGKIYISDNPINYSWCGGMEIWVKKYSDNSVISSTSFYTSGAPHGFIDLGNPSCNDTKGCYMVIRMSQGYGTATSPLNYLTKVEATNYYPHGTLNAPDIYNDVLLQTVGQTRLIVRKEDGHVGVGTPGSAAYEFEVGGKIRATEVVVEPAWWADYVFENTYPLMSLGEVEKYIDQFGHLPNIPSEATVVEQGISLGNMNRVLLEKIEELTLHLIRQQKEIDELKKKVEH
jgi:hypothetical protein